MPTSPRRIATVAALAATSALLSISGLTTATAATAKPGGIYCDPASRRTYTTSSSTWYAYDTGTLNNSSGGTISKSYTHTSNETLATTVSAEVGASAKVVVAEVNAKFGISATVSASYTKSQTFSVSAPPHTKVTYRDGIMKRTYSVKIVQTFSDCDTRTTYGTTRVADNYSEAR